MVDHRVIILVEGASDQAALETLAARRGRDLVADGIAVAALGGAKNVGPVLQQLGVAGPCFAVRGLCDAGEEADFRRGFARAGMERASLFVCVADLEDELIRAVGIPAVEGIVDSEGELGSFRTLQKQPAHRGRSVDGQLRRFIGTRSGRKLRYARLLAASVDLGRVPRPLDGVLAGI